jgi:hypothetical protein
MDLGVDRPRPVAFRTAEPSRGKSLIDHVQIGFAYQMHLKDEWQKVRLTYVSPGRSFFVFTRGKKHQETISLTAPHARAHVRGRPPACGRKRLPDGARDGPGPQAALGTAAAQ